jgi:hypothetical protein
MMDDDYTEHQCDVCKLRRFERNHYFHGKMLSARDLADEQKYFNEKRWLINRMVIGWGVVCGLDVSLDDGCLVVGPGLALDCCGHELLVCDRRKLHVDKFVEVVGGEPRKPPPPSKPPSSTSAGTAADARTQGGYQPPRPEPPRDYPRPDDHRGRWVLCLEFRECRTEPCQTGPARCDHDEQAQYNRIRDDYRLTIRRWKDACPHNHAEHQCPYDGLGRKTPLHQALVERSRHCPVCEACECVVLATGTVDETCDPPEIRLDDDHLRYRRLVYTNPALASLIRCLHDGLAHIKAINWTPGSQFTPDEFLDRLSKDHLQVTFDRPMKARTVTNVRSCRLSVFYTNEGNCLVQLLVPVERIEYDENTTTATYYFDDDCIEQELRKVCRKVKKPADVELILHGSMIHNEHGRALDAELIDELPTGNGVEGGEFIGYFTLQP